MNRTEAFVRDFYKSLNINDPFYLSKLSIIDALNIKLFYWHNTSAIAFKDGTHHLFINKTLNKQQRWQDFGHEMYHYFNDRASYNLLHESYASYGESKADYFAYHFCVPTFMLLQLKEVSADVITRLFNVEFDFALRRLDMFRSKVLLEESK